MVETRQINGRSVTFRRESGTGPALVCLHGSAANHHTYDPLVDARPGRACYAINLPGRLGTAGPALDTVAELESFLAAFVESEVEGDYVVAGHSLGGGVAIEHALTSASDRLKGLVLLATGARLRVHPMILQIMEQAESTGMRPGLPPGLHEPGADPAILEQSANALALTPIATGACDWRAANAFDRMSQLQDIQVPSLILVGSEDALTPPKYAKHLATHMPNSTLHVFDGATHSLMMDRALAVSEAIEDFYQRQILS